MLQLVCALLISKVIDTAYQDTESSSVSIQYGLIYDNKNRR